MDPVVEIAIIGAVSAAAAAFSAGLSPVIQARINSSQRQRERAEDRADRQEVAKKVDDAAAQAGVAAKLLAAAQEETIKKTDEVKAAAAATAAENSTALKQIHTLVNSDKTVALQTLLDQTKLTLAVLRKMVTMDQEAGRDATQDDLTAIKTAEANIAELEKNLADRAIQAKAVEDQVKAAAADADRRQPG